MSFERLILSARHALPLMEPVAAREVEALANAMERELRAESSIALAWESDLQPLRSAISAALHSGGMEALAGLRHLLPGLLREVNQAPAFTKALALAMAKAFDEGFREDLANAVSIAETTTETDGLRQIRQRQVFETDLSSAELRSFSQGLRSRSIFSARTTNAEYLEEVKAVCDEILSGKINQATGRLRLLGKLKELGYDPAIGFPGDLANVPPAEKDSLQDLSSTRRLDLVIETNVRMAQNYGRMLAGNQPYELREYPAWELVRLYRRDVERGSPDSKTDGWRTRWEAAANDGGVDPASVADKQMIARKDSAIWQALGDGIGGYTDTLLNPFPPFAFRSGMGWRAVPRAECLKIGLVKEDEVPAPMQGTLAPGESEIVKAYDRLSPELQAELRRELEALDL